MDPAFWHARWQTRQTGFHQPAVNALLQRHWPALALPAQARVYVPLCGKSLDMPWLAARGHPVVGSELSRLAVDEFFAERGLTPRCVDAAGIEHVSGGGYELLRGDAFALTRADTGALQALYDRAALVALPPALRPAYVASLARLLPSGARGMLLSFEYPQALRAGPPFSVPRDELLELLAAEFELTELERVELIETSPNFAAAGVRSVQEVAYAIERR